MKLYEFEIEYEDGTLKYYKTRTACVHKAWSRVMRSSLAVDAVSVKLINGGNENA